MARDPVDVASATGATWIAVGAYLGSTLIPFERDLPLLLLALASAGIFAISPRRVAAPPVRNAILAFVASVAISTVLSVDVVRSLRLGAPLLPGLLVYVLVAGQLADTAHVRRLCAAVAVLALAVAAMLIVTATQGDPSPAAVVARARIPLLVVPNDVTLLAVIAPLSLGLLVDRRSRAVRVTAALSIAASAFAIALLRSRVATLTLVGTLGVAGILVRPRLAAAVIGGAVALLAGADAALGWPLLAKFGQTTEPRMALWLAALELFRRAPLLGHGAHTFGALYRDALAGIALPAWAPFEGRDVPWPHNLYLEVAAEQGVVGLIALLTVLGLGVATAWRAHRSANPDERGLTAGIVAALLGVVAAGVIELTLLRQWVVLLVFVLLGCCATPDRRKT